MEELARSPRTIVQSLNLSVAIVSCQHFSVDIFGVASLDNPLLFACASDLRAIAAAPAGCT